MYQRTRKLPNGRIVIDANNPIKAPLFKPADLGARVSSQVFADLAPGARVVKAFNHLRSELIATDPLSDGSRVRAVLEGYSVDVVPIIARCGASHTSKSGLVENAEHRR